MADVMSTLVCLPPCNASYFCQILCDYAVLSFYCYLFHCFCYNSCYFVIRISDQPEPSVCAIKLFSSPKKKRPKRAALNPAEKNTIINIYKLVEEAWPKDQFWYKKDLAKKKLDRRRKSLHNI